MPKTRADFVREVRDALTQGVRDDVVIADLRLQIPVERIMPDSRLCSAEKTCRVSPGADDQSRESLRVGVIDRPAKDEKSE
jgi:hypothetical protein